MLKHPFLNIPYKPKLQYLLSGLDIYDREESLGEALANYNINSPADREKLIKKHIIDRSTDLNHRHRKSLIDVLSSALNDSSYDFSEILSQDPESHCALPYGWDAMENPRGFFEDIFILANKEWKNDLGKASLEDQSTW